MGNLENRNAFLFTGHCWDLRIVVKKAQEDSSVWFKVNQEDVNEDFRQ